MRVVIALVFLELFAIATIINVSFCNGSSHVDCIESEGRALLRFKRHLTDPSNRLASWVGDYKDCCKWSGVVCGNFTGHVLELHLRNPHLEYFSTTLEFEKPNHQISAAHEAYNSSMLGGKISPSLLDLTHLLYLDLSGNDFGGIQIPAFLGSMENLRYLNFSRARFSGKVPSQLGNISTLQYLDLYSVYTDFSGLYADDLIWISSLSLLEQLDLSGVELSTVSDWLYMINALPSLKLLKLSSCHIDHFPPLMVANFSSLVVLDLSTNQFIDTMIPGWVFGLKHLVFLDLSRNLFEGSIPDGLGNLTSLRYLDLYLNHFNSSIPEWLYRLSHLEYLSLSQNNLEGVISHSLGNLSSIKTLDLSRNPLKGKISKSFEKLCNLRSISLSYTSLSQDILEVIDIFSTCASYKLEHLDLSSCQMSGYLTNEFGQFKNLNTLNLRNNSISGPIPTSFGQLSSLQFLDISFNKLNGILSEVHLTNLTKLFYFDVSKNSFTLKVRPDWIPSFQLEVLGLRSCYLGSQFPSWLHSQKFLYNVDISNCGIQDTIPDKFWKSLSQFKFVIFSHNQMYGEVPNLTEADNLYYLDLSSNNFSGPLPLIASNIFQVDLSNNSFSGSLSPFLCDNKMNVTKETLFLRLRGNFLFGELPDCWMFWPNLEYLDLGDNKFVGKLPASMATLSLLSSLHLQRNFFSGTIPVSLGNCSQLIALDAGENRFAGNVPTWIGDRFPFMIILNLRSNKFHGFLPVELCRLSSLQILDLAYNNLNGTIPRCVDNFTAIVDTSTESNSDISYANDFVEDATLVMKGTAAQYESILNLVRTIDLSMNNFSGQIPVEVTNLKALQSLNLSHNLFSGRIPQGVGAMVSIESIDFSANHLDGKIPESMSHLTFLNHLNLSHNNLIGKIPSSTQLQSFDPSSFMGNNLCGLPLPNCTEPSPPSNHENYGEKDGEEHEVNWFYVSMAVGFVVGFWGFVGSLLVNRRWRYTYCRFLDRLGYSLPYVPGNCF